MKKLLLVICLAFFALTSHAQTATIADWSLTSIDRQKHQLHATLEADKTVIVYFFDATKSNCRFASKLLERVYQQHKSSHAVEVWAFDLNPNTKNRHLKNYRNDNELHYTIFGTGLNRQDLAQLYKQYGSQTPEFLIIHPNKTVSTGIRGLKDLKVVSNRLVQTEVFVPLGQK